LAPAATLKAHETPIARARFLVHCFEARSKIGIGHSSG
jgi:hypothetical protein